MAFTWKLLDKEGNLIQMVNCQFDSLDFAYMNNAKSVEVDFEKEEAKIIELREED